MKNLEAPRSLIGRFERVYTRIKTNPVGGVGLETFERHRGLTVAVTATLLFLALREVERRRTKVSENHESLNSESK